MVDSIIQDKKPFQNVKLNDIWRLTWIEDDLFDSHDTQSVVETSKKIIDEITPDPLIDLNIATPPDTDDEIDFTITDSQLVEGNNTKVDRDTEPFADFTITESRIADDADNNNDDIDFTITDSQLVDGDDIDVNRETEPFVDFAVTDSRVVDSNLIDWNFCWLK